MFCLCVLNSVHLYLTSLPGQSTWYADVRPMQAQLGSWRWPRSVASTRSSWRAATWQSSPQIQRTAPGTRSWLHTPYHSRPEWTTVFGSPLCGQRVDPRPSRRLPGSPSPHLHRPTATDGAAPYPAVDDLKTASCPTRRNKCYSRTYNSKNDYREELRDIKVSRVKSERSVYRIDLLNKVIYGTYCI